MARINYKYCEDKVLYDDGDIEAEMLSMYKEGKVPNGDRFFYTTTPVRENIINWYPFKKGSTILEVGGGLGSITGALCKDAKKVISCEHSKRRAEIIYYRHKDCENLEVIVGNLSKIKLKEKVDYIVLIGVYEYAKRFFQTENPFEGFLNLLKSFLKPGGVILIAIENRYGVKYWAGATEDHYGVKYLGLKNYNHYDIETLGKRQLRDIVEKAGLFHKFYYPYPDYKMPYLIHTDQRLPLRSELKALQIYNHGEQVYNFDYREVLEGLIDNDQYGFFANSFLIEISNKKSSLSDIVFAKSSWIREKKYQNITRIDNKNNIIKIVKGIEGEEHLDLMCQTHKKLEDLGVKVSKIEKNDEGYAIEFIEGISLTEHIFNLTKQGNKEAILKEIEGFHNLLKSLSYASSMKKFTSEKAKKYFKGKTVDILKLGTLDLHMGNIIKKGADLYIIDQEWFVDYDVPVSYIKYFSTTILFQWIPELESLFNLQDILKKYGIGEKEAEIYLEMSAYFSLEVFKNVRIEEEQRFVNRGIVKIIDEEINNLNRELEETTLELGNTRSELEATNLELANTRSELVSLQNRKAIKISNKVARIKNKLLKMIKD